MWDDMVPDAPLACRQHRLPVIVIANAALVVSAVHLRPSLLESVEDAARAVGDRSR